MRLSKLWHSVSIGEEYRITQSVKCGKKRVHILQQFFSFPCTEQNLCLLLVLLSRYAEEEGLNVVFTGV